MIIAPYIALILYGSLVLWLLFGLDRRKIPMQNRPVEKITVIVAVRNNRGPLLCCLEALARQNYPHPFGVLVVDDHSQDGTLASAEQFVQNHPHWRVLTAASQPTFISSKKAALHQAIMQTDSEWLVFTDADCIPPPTWLQSLADHFFPQTVLVAGFSPQFSSANSWWRRVLLIDSLSAALVSAATIGRQSGVTGAGRNLAYRRSAWCRISGFNSLPDTLSGDDDFIIQKMSRVGRVYYCMAPEAVVPAQGPENLREFLRQKQRHLSSGRCYPVAVQATYGLYHGLNLLLWLCAVGSLFYHQWLYPLLGKWLIDALALYSFSRLLRQNFSWIPFLIWQGIFVFYHVRAGWQRFQQPTTWQAN
jgi:cellulose synthase/poly-beta-1,6-N-acetylglucosamine synthase-like glycosyltransferase